MMYGLWDYYVFTVLRDSLEDAFLARQRKSATRPCGWGERVFAHLEQEHREWASDIVWIYAAAQQMLQRFLLRQCCDGLSHAIYRRPENFLDGVLLQLGQPRNSPN